MNLNHQIPGNKSGIIYYKDPNQFLFSQKKSDINFIESDFSNYSREAKADIYHLIGIVETKTAYYKVLSYCSLENKAKFKADFQKILCSLKD